jgi:hypothetical protein
VERRQIGRARITPAFCVEKKENEKEIGRLKFRQADRDKNLAQVMGFK